MAPFRRDMVVLRGDADGEGVTSAAVDEMLERRGWWPMGMVVVEVDWGRRRGLAFRSLRVVLWLCFFGCGCCVPESRSLRDSEGASLIWSPAASLV